MDSDVKRREATVDELKNQLLEAYQDEVTSGLNYLSVGLGLEGLFGEMLGEDLTADFTEEMQHAQELAEILDRTFDVVVPNAPDIDTARQPYLDELGGPGYVADNESLLEVTDAVIQAEREAIERYERLVELSEKLAYPDVRDVAARFLADERMHLDEMESAREQFRAN